MPPSQSRTRAEAFASASSGSRAASSRVMFVSRVAKTNECTRRASRRERAENAGEARILRHAARDIDEGDERRMPRRRGAVGEIDRRAAAAQLNAEGTARIDAAAGGSAKKRRVGRSSSRGASRR